MTAPRGRFRALLAGAAFLLVALPATVSTTSAAVPSATWGPPTPEEGQKVTVTVGKELLFSLAATAPAAPVTSLTITEEGLPLGTEFEPVAGNPATATVKWVPAADQAGLSFLVTFTATTNAPAFGPAVRNITLVAVKPKPRPRPRKVVLCFRGRTIKVKKTAVKRYLKRGAKRGKCKPRRG
jgi:hypothetical protein